MLRVRAAKIDITPPLGLDLQGYAGRNQGAQSVLDHLYARCVVLESTAPRHGRPLSDTPPSTETTTNTLRWALLSLDVISLETDDARALRDSVQALLGTRNGQVTLSTTHTHSGPALLRLRNFGDVDAAYFQFLTEAVHRVVQRAVDQLQPAFALTASGRTEFAVNRRKPDEKGNILLTPYSEGPVDHEVIVTAFYPVETVARPAEPCGTGTEGSSETHGINSPDPLAVITNYACHPVTLGTNFEISADFPGVYAMTVEKAFPGSLALYLNGTSGDINPPAMDGWATTKACGLSLAGETIKVIARMQHDVLSRSRNPATAPAEPTGPSRDDAVADKATPSPLLAWRETVVELPLRDLPPRDVLEDELARFRRQLDVMLEEKNREPAAQPTDHTRATAALIAWAKACLAELDGGDAHPNNREAHVQTVIVGDTAFVFLPGEIFVEYGMEIKRRSSFVHTHVVGYTNGWIGYVPTPDAIEKGGYEPTAYRYWQNRPFDADAGSLLVTRVLSQLDELARLKTKR